MSRGPPRLVVTRSVGASASSAWFSAGEGLDLLQSFKSQFCDLFQRDGSLTAIAFLFFHCP